MEFQVRYLALYLLFSEIDSFKWFWMESLHKNIQLMLDFLKAPFFVQHFSYYTLTTFLMILSVMLLSMLMILISIPSVTRHLICGNNLNWLLNSNLDWGKNRLVGFNAWKTRLVSFDIFVKMDGSVLAEKSTFKMLG